MELFFLPIKKWNYFLGVKLETLISSYDLIIIVHVEKKKKIIMEDESGGAELTARF